MSQLVGIARFTFDDGKVEEFKLVRAVHADRAG
jgi:hypothetical protein